MTKLRKATENKIDVRLTEAMLHAKAIVCDDTRYLIGSCNLNRSSFKVYLESNVLVSHVPKGFKQAFDDSISFLKENSLKVTKSDDLSYDSTKAFCEGLAETDYGIGIVCSLPFMGLGLIIFVVRRIQKKRSLVNVKGV